ncbi:hypothetical protein FGO68_gene11365 [Halteria grandinella]|uniref:Uncharacterized protein n=1 Tax=Halteria grandinella TaxID=5974 RepID=A0A8J8NAZ6_HALGN|nr:hypothetical protein FGO68_gene11365 [Halteria grandinella]
MNAILMVHRSHDRNMIHDTSLIRQAVTHPDTGHLSRDRRIAPPIFGRGVGLRVIGFLLTQAPVGPEDDDRLTTWLLTRDFRIVCPHRLQAQQIRQRQTKSWRADAQQGSAIQ